MRRKQILIIFALFLFVGCQAASNLVNLDALNSLNTYVNNSSKYIPDKPGADYWRAPYEFATAGGGDCEDFAIYKKYLLDNSKLYDYESVLIVGQIKRTGVMHAVLLVEGNYVLDLRNEIYSLKQLRQEMDIKFASDEYRSYRCIPKIWETCINFFP